MKRRDVLMMAGAAAAASGGIPLRAIGQTNPPVIGFLHSASQSSFERQLSAFKAGLKEGGYVEARNVAIEYRWASGDVAALPRLAADLVNRSVAVIATGGAERPIYAAQAATSTNPIVFVGGGDPVQMGIVTNFARPNANTTGINIRTTMLEAKRFGLLKEMLPRARKFAALVNPSRAVALSQIEELSAAAAQLDAPLTIVRASNASELSNVFLSLREQAIDALQVCADPYFFSQRELLVALAAAQRLPAIYEWRDFPEIGGLASYGTDLAESYRQSGLYVAKILKGSLVSDLPVMQTTRFEFVINLNTLRTFGLEIAPTIIARADDIIE